MTCPAVLTVVAGSGWLMKAYQVPCKKEHAKGAHEPDLSSLPLKFEGERGTWVARIRL